MKIKKGDNVIVLAGKDKGKTGTVETSMPREEQVIVTGVNLATKHQKNRRARSQGQIIEREMPIHVSNVALVEDGKPARAGYQFSGEGEKRKKERISRQSKKAL